MDNKVMKPITVARQEFVDNILQLCNDAEIPLFCIEDVLKSLLKEIHGLAIQQYESDKQTYENDLKEFEKEECEK